MLIMNEKNEVVYIITVPILKQVLPLSIYIYFSKIYIFSFSMLYFYSLYVRCVGICSVSYIYSREGSL